jgi:hypothetical protein
MKLLIELFCLSFLLQFYWYFWHVTVRTIRFESDCNYISKLVHKNLHIIAQLVLLCFIFCLVFSQYLSIECFCQYIPTELTTENFPTFHWHWQDIYSLLTSNCANWIVVSWHQWLRTNIYNVSHDPKVFSFLELIFPFSILNKK